jgi:hypothetical protein
MIEITADLTWEILKMDVHTIDQQHGVVLTVHWCLSAAQSANAQIYTGYTYGAVDLDYNPNGSFVPLDQLDKNTVLAWIWEELDKTQHEEQVQVEINNKIDPLSRSITPPWSN